MGILTIESDTYDVRDHKDVIRLLFAFDITKAEDIITVDLEDFEYTGNPKDYIKLLNEIR